MDPIKRHLFADGDLGLTPFTVRNVILQEGQQAKLLLGNKIFMQVVSELYLSLVSAEDETLNPAPDFCMQRRLLRQLIAALDNKVHAYEQLEEQLKLEKDLEDGNDEI